LPTRRASDLDGQEDARYRCDRFGQRLGEGELGVERTSRLWVGAKELPGIGNPFVDEDHGGPVAAEQLVQCLPGRGTGLVAGADDLVPFSAAELPGELTPDGVHLGAVVLSLTGDGQVLSDECDPAHRARDVVVAVLAEQVLQLL